MLLLAGAPIWVIYLFMAAIGTGYPGQTGVIQAMSGTEFLLSFVASGLVVLILALEIRRRSAWGNQAGANRTPYEWEAETGIQIVDYTQWRKEGIGLDKPIPREEFERLAKASCCRHRRDLHAFER